MSYRKRRRGPARRSTTATREFGGTLGVAVIGSVFASLYLHGLQSSRAASVVPPAVFAQSKESVGAALLGARALAKTNPHVASVLTQAAQHAFFHGFQVGCLVAAGVALVGAAVVAVVLPARPTQVPEPELVGLPATEDQLQHAG